MKPFSEKTKGDLLAELINEWDGSLSTMADNYGRSETELKNRIGDPCENCELIIDCKDCSIFKLLHE